MILNKRTLLGFGVLLALGAAGCPGPPKDTSGGGTNTTTNTTPTKDPKAKPFRAALVFDLGGPDDKSFNASANAGLEKAKNDLNLGSDGIKTVESHTAADYKTNLTNFASQNYDVVIAVGFAMADAVKEVSAQFPNTHFAIVDADAPDKSTNVVGLKFREEQGSFLAGYLAAMVSKTKKIGFVGGMKIPLIEKFEAGYKAGAKTAGLDPDSLVKASYVGDWNDLNKAKQQADLQFGQGVDIIYQAAGKAGQSVIDAAKEHGKGFYAIGVDQNQDDVQPGFVLTSMIKHVDTAVFDTIKDAKDGKFTPGNKMFSMKEDGVGLSEMKYTKKDIPADVLTKLQKLSDMVKTGTVVPPTKLADLAAFKPPVL